MCANLGHSNAEIRIIIKKAIASHFSSWFDVKDSLETKALTEFRIHTTAIFNEILENNDCNAKKYKKGKGFTNKFYSLMVNTCTPTFRTSLIVVVERVVPQIKLAINGLSQIIFP